MFFKGLFGKSNGEKSLKEDNCKTEVTNEIVSGIFSVDEKLIAGAYYSDEKIKALATNLGCIKLDEKPELIEKKNVITLQIDALLLKLKNNKVEDFISIKELV